MENSKWITSFMKQTWCASGILIGIIAHGMVLGFPASLLPALRKPDSPIKVDLHSGSWLASSMGPALPIGITGACFLMDYRGRRTANLLVILPGVIGWLMIYLAQSYAELLIGRMLTSLAAGAMHAIALVMLAEYISPENRGMFLNCKSALYCVGNTIVHLLGNYMHWRTIALCALIPNFVSFLFGCTYVESPTWLASRKQFDKCKENFLWLRGCDDTSLREVTELIEAQKERLSRKDRKVSVLGNVSKFLQRFAKKDFIKPLTVLVVAFLMMEASGRHFFPPYALQIMSEILNADSLPYYYTLGVDLVITISSIFSVVLVRLMKRRTLLFSTGIASLLVLTVVCVYLFLVSKDILSKDRQWIVTFLFIAYFSLINLGCAPLPLVLQGELLPVAHREAGGAVMGLVLSVLITSTIKATPYLLIATKVYGTFAIFGVILATTLLITYFILPETKDRTLQEIENYFTYGIIKTDEIKSDDIPLTKYNEEYAQ